MAEPARPPSLPSTADATPYAPVAWPAVAAMAATVAFALILLVAGYGAVRARKPLLLDWVLVLPAAAIVLSFAGRRIIRTSEGTRTGELFGIDLVATSWWTSLVLLLGYGAYLFAVEYAVRRDAENEVMRWVGLILDDKIPQAFDRTLPPGGRFNDEARLVAVHRQELLVFRQSDLVRVALRNRPDATFVPGGLRDWVSRPTGVECVFAGTLKCPEGSFPVHVQLKGNEGASGSDAAAAGRQWQVIPSQNGFVQWDKATRTRYGYLLGELERQGGAFGRDFVAIAGNGMQSFAFLGYTREGTDPKTWGPTTLGRVAVAGGLTAVYVLPEDQRAGVVRLFRLPGGAEPDAKQKESFMQIWNRAGVAPPGSRIRNSMDTTDLVDVTDAAVEVRVPVELPLGGSGLYAARGRVVVACTDRAVLDELKRLRAEANPDRPADNPDEFRNRPTSWRVVAIESDLYEVRPPPGPGEPPPGMPGG